jgi:hypothetical protein
VARQETLKPEAAEQAVAADRFAPEIVGILGDHTMRSRRLNGKALGG